MEGSKDVQELNNRYFTAHAAGYGEATYWRGDEDNITKHFFPKPGKLLIAGVGGGRTVPHLLKEHHVITGIDIVPEMIEQAKKYEGDFRVMDMAHLAFSDSTFDYVFSPFNSVSATDDAFETIKELRRVLKPGGVLVFQVPNQRPGSKWWFTRRGEIQSPEGAYYQHFFNMFDVFKFKRMFAKAYVYGRMQWSNGRNWKDRVLKAVPFMDKALYFVCVK
jgi:ubiquinone/menaquinone biosynthesis C-methylase UbiE